MTLEPIQYLLGAGSGSLVGFTLGLVGGGGSILAVPLMAYLVGVASPHVAIGTSALAVAANAGANLVPHARQRTIKWRCAGMFAAAGVAGTYTGSTLGKAFDGQKLLFLFALLMILVGALVVLALITIALVSSALGGVYAATVYRYTAEGDAGSFFAPDLVQNAFRQK